MQSSTSAQSTRCFSSHQRSPGWLKAGPAGPSGAASAGSSSRGGVSSSEIDPQIDLADRAAARLSSIGPSGDGSRLFALYRELGCVRRVKDAADRLGLRTKSRMTAEGIERGGKRLSRGHIYRLLANSIYTGQTAHKGGLYPGQHPALIDAENWNAVRDRLAANTHGRRSRSRAAEPSLLAGLLFDASGGRLTPSHAVENGRRYRYDTHLNWYWLAKGIALVAGGE